MTVYEKVYSNPDVYKIFVPLPDNPLQNLNCFVIKTPERNLIIDTGFNRPECEEALRTGLKELEIDINNSDLYLTHLHSDHVGLAATIMPEESTIYMGRVDYDYLMTSVTGSHWEDMDKMFHSHGFPDDKIIELHTKNPARAFQDAGPFDAVKLEDGDKFTVGGYEFKCIYVPGHTPGNTCLYYEKDALMFLGDHVLFDITPNITSWYGVRDSLSNYIESLKKIRQYKMETALPAHRNTKGINVYDRIDQLLVHHQERLKDTEKVVRMIPGSTAYEIAAYMKWQMRGKNWEEFPVSQRWFAVGETIAHLDYLMNKGLVRCDVDSEGIHRYTMI